MDMGEFMIDGYPPIKPYAHIFFCDDLIKDPDSNKTNILGEYGSIIRIPENSPIIIDSLKVCVEINFDKRDLPRKVVIQILRDNEVIIEKVLLKGDISGYIERLSEIDAEATGASFSWSFDINEKSINDPTAFIAQVFLNDELSSRKNLRFRRFSTAQDSISESSLVRRNQARPQPAIPSLLLVPGDTVDVNAIFSFAVAYADAGILVSDRGHHLQRVELAFPAMVCCSFALELFLKFFIAKQRVDANLRPKWPQSHDIAELWRKVSDSNKNLIAGMFKNGTGVPMTQGVQFMRERFEVALNEVGESPFIKWRYAFGLSEGSLMSHQILSEVVDAFGYAAQYLLSQSNPSGSS